METTNSNETNNTLTPNTTKDYKDETETPHTPALLPPNAQYSNKERADFPTETDFLKSKIAELQAQQTKTKRKPRHKIKPELQALDQPTILSLGDTLTRAQDRAFYYFLYLFGLRVTEALALPTNCLEKTTNPTYGDYWRIVAPNRKNQTTKLKTLPGVIKTPAEEKMLNFVLAYSQVAHQNNPNAPLFPYAKEYNNADNHYSTARRIAYQRLSRITITTNALMPNGSLQNITRPLHPHYLRKCRLTHLWRLHKYDSIALKQFAGWTDERPANAYITIREEDLLR